MAIAPKCIDQLNTAAGRKLTDAQLADIESRLRRTASNLARDDLAKWRTMTPDQRTLAAAERAMADIRAEAERKVRNAALQVLKTAATAERLDQHQRAMGDANRHQALARDLEQTESRAQAIKHEAVATMLETIDAAKSGEGVSVMRRVAMFLFDADNPKMSHDLALEVFAGADGSTGNTLAQRGAKAWLETIETMRKRFNNAGGDVGRLDYGYLPQPHDMVRVLKAGADAWSNFMLSRVDRGRYLNPDGTPFNDTQMLDMLRASWETISSGGANKREPGAFAGNGARANRGSESRELHFRDGEAYLEYLAQFGNGSMYDAMVGHVAGKARDIALLEQYGPNPNNQMRLQMDLAERADGGTRRVFGQRIETLWSVANGTSGSVVGTGQLAAVGGAVRNIQVAGKLAGALLSSVTDTGTYFITAGYNRLPYWEALRNIATANRAEARDWMASHGMIAESLMFSMNRWTGENISEGWTGRLANSTMKLSGLNAWTNGLRRGFQMTMMSGLARLHGTEWGKLSEYDRGRLESAGFKETDWNIVQSAALEDYKGTAMLTPDAVRQVDPQVATKLMSLILDESETAVINPDLATRAWVTAGLERGTVRGELWRSVMQFKSFPIAMISRHWRRAFDVPDGLDGAPALANRYVYLSALGVTLTALGAVAFQAKQIVSGKDPVDMTKPKFWMRAAAQGGAAGFFGDVLLENTSDSLSRTDPLFRLAGPTAGSAADFFELTKGNLDEMLAGKETHAGAEALRFVRGHMPYVNLWYAKTALERGVLNDVQESVSPGYLARQRQKMRKDWGQEFWWEPTDALPARAPDLSAAGGR
jgi:hypothetical protein